MECDVWDDVENSRASQLIEERRGLELSDGDAELVARDGELRVDRLTAKREKLAESNRGGLVDRTTRARSYVAGGLDLDDAEDALLSLSTEELPVPDDDDPWFDRDVQSILDSAKRGTAVPAVALIPETTRSEGIGSAFLATGWRTSRPAIRSLRYTSVWVTGLPRSATSLAW